ncbi:MAG: radical SAM protein [Candidatus Nezhaarchaeota archaeon]|nr:radical SAM protein [Candidatus Nezhaarchaeota archaeon]
MVRVIEVKAKRALTPSGIYGVDYSLNPYVGCQHACVYCYVPYSYRAITPAEWGKVVKAKVNLAPLLGRELKSIAPCKVLIGSITDPYQPLEARLGLTKACLEILRRADADVVVLTKSSLLKRDLDALGSLRNCEVGVTVTTLKAYQWLEPNSPPPSERLSAIREASTVGLDTFVFLGPLIPTIVDLELDLILDAVVEAGCRRVVVDKLRLRPGMVQALIKSLSFLKNPLPVIEKAKSPEYYEELKAKIFAHAKDRGIEAVFCY